MSSSGMLITETSVEVMQGSNVHADNLYVTQTPNTYLCADATYSFAVDGGAISTIPLTISPAIPAGAIVFAYFINVTTTIVGVGASIALGLETTTDLLSATAITNDRFASTNKSYEVTTNAGGKKPVLLESGATELDMTVSAAALTAGIIEFKLHYFLPNVV